MNIAIVTVYQPFSNYGSFLQAYALKTFLESQGHNVKFIKTSSHLLSVLQLVAYPRPYRSYFQRIKKAIHSMLDLNRLSYTSTADQRIDCFIWGSDEIWNVTNNFFCRPIFFGQNIDNVPKIGYAISVGHATENDFTLNRALTQGAKYYDKIFTRDLHSKLLLQKCFDIKSDIVVDPTLLINVKELTQRIKCPSKKYILVYTYGIDKNMISIVKKFAKKHQLQIISPCFWHIWADKTIECSALQFSTLIANAEYVFTTTFHGAIFSLINHSRCCILPLREKVRNLCETLKCTSRLITSDTSYEEFETTISQDFPTDVFEDNLARLRIASSNLIISELNRIQNEKFS